MFADKDTIYVSGNIAVRSDEIILEWGKSLISFESDMGIRDVISGCNYVGWDPLKGESFTVSVSLADIPVKVGGTKDWTKVSNGGSEKFIETIVDMQLTDADEAKQRALGQLQKNSFLFGQASGRTEGNYKLRPGMRVTVKMAGESFDGEYIAESVCHRFDYSEGYTTSFTLKRNMCS